ncbi:hypothetical protein WJX73_000686 [Symbiochloris irregularis]|uniref:3,4-dihydroxy-2-butanone 4-phosphate synthase n=1 Tax=Symbiochloris irregularis TaxID=706552 RepID=A0AAW1PQF4_9CHLO
MSLLQRSVLSAPCYLTKAELISPLAWQPHVERCSCGSPASGAAPILAHPQSLSSPFRAQKRAAGLLPQAASLALHDTEAVSTRFDSVEDALAALSTGQLVVVLDNEDRENEGDLIMSGDKVTSQAMAFMVEHTTGIICAAMRGRDLDRLDLPLMVPTQENEEALCTAFTITVDARSGTTTGVSASDRCETLRTLADPHSDSYSLRRPGHIFPLRCREGGVLFRPGHTEAAVQLVEMAGCSGAPVGVLSEVVDRRDGSMARTPYLLQFAKDHGLKCITIASLVRYLTARGAAPDHRSVGLVNSSAAAQAIDDTAFRIPMT